MNREKKLIFNTLILTFGTILPKIANFLVLPILTSYLTKLEYGTYDLLLTSISFVLPLLTLQIEQAVFRFLINNEVNNRKKVISSSAAFLLISTILFIVVGIIILRSYESSLKILILSYGILNMLYLFFLQVNRGIGKLKVYSFMTATNTLLNSLFILIFVWNLEKGLFGLLLALNLAILLTILIGGYYSNFFTYLSVKAVKLDMIRKLLRYSVPLLPNTISWWIVSLSDRWIISSMLTVNHNAIYAIANKIPNLFNLFYNNFNLAWQESASLSMEDNDINNYYSTVFSALFNFLMGSILVLISTSPIVFNIFINESYSEAFFQMPILFISVFIHSLGSFFGGIYVAFKQSAKVGKSAILGASINILVNIILINKIGLYASSISSVLAYTVILVYRSFDVQKIVKISYDFKRIALCFCILILSTLLSVFNIPLITKFNIILSLFIAAYLNKVVIKNFFFMLKTKIKQ